MAAPASKRRKVGHNTSQNEEDTQSFASFDESSSDEKEDVEEESDGSDGDSSLGDPSRGDNKHARSGNMPLPQKTVSKKDTRDAISNTSPYVAGDHKSSMFKLQVDELLQQIRPRRGKKESEAETALHRLKGTIEKIPSQESLPVDEAERQLLASTRVAIPFPDPRPQKDAKYKLGFSKPANINVVGSHILRTSVRSKKTVEIDMVVTMPASLFQEKDYLNLRYFYKRAYYIASIAAGLRKHVGEEYSMRYRSFHGDHLKPILVVTPGTQEELKAGQKQSPKWQINIIPCISEDTFDADRLAPEKCCIRNQPLSSTSKEGSTASPAATPFYNASLRSDMLMTSYLRLLHGTSKSCESYSDACLLGNTWLRQRGFGSDTEAGGFGNFEWSALIALLLQGGGPGGRPVLSTGYTGYQLFKATIQVLAMKNLCKQPIVVEAADGKSDVIPGKQPTVWDATRKHNILFKMSPWSYKLLQREARTSHAMLSDSQFDGFDSTFILRTDGSTYRYDYIVELDASFSAAGGTGHDRFEMYHNLYDKLKQGLGDRAEAVNIIPPASEMWDLGSTTVDRRKAQKVMVGIMVNSVAAARTVDHGPSAEEKSKSAAFRQFWGEKAELRRFRDGSIQETLVWSGKEHGPSVIEQIIRYVVQRHLGQQAEKNMSILGDSFRRLLPHGSASSTFQPYTDAFKQLETDIRSLEGLPLVVRAIMPAGAQLRLASVKPPSHDHNITPADTTIQFEGSSRWPDDLIAIQRTKIAFLLKLREQLEESIDGLTARLGLENAGNDILNQGYLDIVYDVGAAFRLRIHHEREQTLLTRQLQDKALSPKTKEVAALGLAEYRRNYVKTPAHTQAIARLCGLHPALSGTIRLMKKWFASHLLANHIAEEVIELIAARTFVQPWPWQTPSTVQTGFLRTLFWLSRWDWKVDPLIVDLSGNADLKSSDVQSIRTKFEAWRKLDPVLNRVVLFAASNVDQDGNTWTDGRPAKVVAGRMTALARAACAEAGEKQLRLSPNDLFESPLSDFDFVIRFDPVTIGRKSHRKQAGVNGKAFKNLELDLIDDASRVGFDAFGNFLEEIETLYGSTVLLFSGGHERPMLAGLWNPQTARRSWKVNLAYSTVPLKDPTGTENKADVNKEAILDDVARIGGDMIQKIESQGR